MSIEIYLLPFFGEGNGTPLQYSCLENPMDGEAWQASVHGVTRSRTRLSDGDGQGGLVCCDSWGHKELDRTEQRNWTELNWRNTFLKVLQSAVFHLKDASKPHGVSVVICSINYPQCQCCYCFTSLGSLPQNNVLLWLIVPMIITYFFLFKVQDSNYILEMRNWSFKQCTWYSSLG